MKAQKKALMQQMSAADRREMESMGLMGLMDLGAGMADGVSDSSVKAYGASHARFNGALALINTTVSIARQVAWATL